MKFKIVNNKQIHFDNHLPERCSNSIHNEDLRLPIKIVNDNNSNNNDKSDNSIQRSISTPVLPFKKRDFSKFLEDNNETLLASSASSSSNSELSVNLKKIKQFQTEKHEITHSKL